MNRSKTPTTSTPGSTPVRRTGRLAVGHALAALVCAGALAAPAHAHEYRAGELTIGHPWTRPSLPGQPNGAGYMALINAGASADRLLGASTPVAARVELHEMRMEGDVMRMRQVPEVVLAPGASVALSPGGLHMMLIGLKAPLRGGDELPLTLRFDKAGTVEVTLKVEAGAAAAAPAASHGGHARH